MVSQTLRPARVASPGPILRRELEARGLSQKDLASIMGRPAQAINEIISGSKQITPETALELAAALGTSPELWLNLESNYRLHLAQRGSKQDRIERRSRLFSLLPMRELVKRSWIKATDQVEALEREVCEFLGVSSIDQAPSLAASFRHSRDRGAQVGALIAWMKRVEALARAQKVPPFDPERLQAAIPDILALAEREDDAGRLPPLLLSLGVHLVIVPHLEKTYLDGASWFLEERPIIALTLRYDRIDSFWFTLMHEIAHVLAAHEGVHLDDLDRKPDDADEREANRLAGDWIVDRAAYRVFVRTNRQHLSRAAIKEFAASQRRHPGIIIGQLQHDKLLPFNHQRTLLVRVRPFLEEWIDAPQAIPVATAKAPAAAHAGRVR